MSSIIQSFQKNSALPVSQSESKDHLLAGSGPGRLRRRLSSLSLKLQPTSSPTTSWSFPRSKSLSSMGDYAGSSIKKSWDWGWSWVLSKKPVFAQDIEGMNPLQVDLSQLHFTLGNEATSHFFKSRSDSATWRSTSLPPSGSVKPARVWRRLGKVNRCLKQREIRCLKEEIKWVFNDLSNDLD